MQSRFLAAALLAALAISATAHAAPPPASQNFSFSLDGGTPISFTVDPSEIVLHTTGEGVAYEPGPFSDGSTGNIVEFLEPTFGDAINDGAFDFELADAALSPSPILVVGPQLYSGDESAPVFIPGTYNLAADTVAGDTDSIVLTIDGASSTPAVPEPSSLVLLGTGVLSCVGAVRRRFVKA
jgi:hypothetical protein